MHTVQVFSRLVPPAMGAGSLLVDSTVAQSMPSGPVTCVPKVTLPERTVASPVLRNSTVTFSHHRSSVGSRSGSPTISAAGSVGDGAAVPPPVGGPEEGGGVGAEGASGVVRPEPEPEPSAAKSPEVPGRSGPASGLFALPGPFPAAEPPCSLEAPAVLERPESADGGSSSSGTKVASPSVPRSARASRVPGPRRHSRHRRGPTGRQRPAQTHENRRGT